MSKVYIVTYEWDDGTMWVTSNMLVTDTREKAEDYINVRISDWHSGNEEKLDFYNIEAWDIL